MNTYRNIYRFIQTRFNIHIYFLICQLRGSRYNNKTKPLVTGKIGTRDFEDYSKNNFTENLTLRAHFWRRNFVVQKPIKEAKPNPFSLFSQRGNWCEFPNLTHKRQHGLSSFIGWWMSFPAWMEAPEGCYSLMFRINKCSKCIWSIWRAFMRVSGDFINSFCY